MEKQSRGIYLGHYIYAKQLANGEWTLYEGCWSGRAPNSTTGLSVMRDGGKPIRFPSFKQAKDYVVFKYGEGIRR